MGDHEFIRLTIDMLRARLPQNWPLTAPPHAGAPADAGTDADILIADPSGTELLIRVEIKSTIEGRDIEALSSRLHAMRGADRGHFVPMVVAQYLSEPVQKALADRDVNYADATGNIRLASQEPALFLRDVGATSNPWRLPGRPRNSLRGKPPTLVVRALVDFTPPYSVPQLVKLAGSSNGATYRIVDLLEREALLRRDENGRVVEVSWRPLLEAWSRDYSFFTTNAVSRYLAPRGTDWILDRLGDLRPAMRALHSADAYDLLPKQVVGTTDHQARYVVSGSHAAGPYAPYAPARLLTIYADNREELSELLDLRPIDTGANVMIGQASSEAPFQRVRHAGGVWVTAPSQTAVDLMNGPGRNPAEAQELLDWMEHHESSWRLRSK